MIRVLEPISGKKGKVKMGVFTNLKKHLMTFFVKFPIEIVSNALEILLSWSKILRVQVNNSFLMGKIIRWIGSNEGFFEIIQRLRHFHFQPLCIHFHLFNANRFCVFKKLLSAGFELEISSDRSDRSASSARATFKHLIHCLF